jgi:Family of unknown function (DUF6081)
MMGSRSAMAGIAALALALPVVAGSAAGAPTKPTVTVQAYDTFDGADGYTQADYAAKWSIPYGPGEMAAGGTRDFTDGAFSASAVPFRTASDVSVFDHIKYLAVSNDTFEVPSVGSVKFSMDVTAQTPGTTRRRVVHGTYSATGEPYEAVVNQGQQAGATLHMIDFSTGQLFDWFVAGDTAFTLIERLPATVTGSPDGGTRETMYTQIVKEVRIKSGVRHNVSITYARTRTGSTASWHLDGKLVSQVSNVGIPLDVQAVPWTGTYPSLGPGEILKDKINSVSIGHGLFSLLDAFPFQHPDVPELSVTMPISERIFGQGARATFDNVYVTTVTR